MFLAILQLSEILYNRCFQYRVTYTFQEDLVNLCRECLPYTSLRSTICTVVCNKQYDNSILRIFLLLLLHWQKFNLGFSAIYHLTDNAWSSAQMQVCILKPRFFLFLSSVCLSTHPTHASVHTSIHPSIHPAIYLPICLSSVYLIYYPKAIPKNHIPLELQSLQELGHCMLGFFSVNFFPVTPVSIISLAEVVLVVMFAYLVFQRSFLINYLQERLWFFTTKVSSPRGLCAQ